MRLNDAVHAVTGEVFRDGWSRVRGSMQGLHVAKQMTRANRMGQGADGGTRAEFSELRLAQMRGLARFILDSADEIDLLLRRRRDAMQLEATAALREFAHAAE